MSLSAGLVMIAVGCSNAKDKASSPTSTPSTVATTPTPTVMTVPSTVAGTGTTVSLSPSGIENLAADNSTRSKLLATFVAFRSDAKNTPGYAAIPPGSVGGISPGTLFYAYDPASRTHWAVADFYPTAQASSTMVAVAFQDGGDEAVLTQPDGKGWVVEYVGQCQIGLPAAVAHAWGLHSPPLPCSHG